MIAYVCVLFGAAYFIGGILRFCRLDISGFNARRAAGHSMLWPVFLIRWVLLALADALPDLWRQGTE